jgi:hypothetical protein
VWTLRRGAVNNKLSDPSFKARFGFLYAMYRPEFVVWELAGLLTKFTLAAIPVFATVGWSKSIKSVIQVSALETQL